MIYDLNDIDLVKAITRGEAKSVHKELPPGGAWKTINGHHIYVKDGKVLAGAIPGVTKAKKASKAQLAEHQATMDAKGKKKDGDTGKSKGTGKASKTAGKKSGSDSKGTSGAKKTKAGGSGKKAGEIDEVSKKPAKATKGTKSGAGDKPTPAGKSKATAKPGAKKAGSKTKKVAEEGKANGTTKVGAKTDGKSKAKPTAKSSRTRGTVSATGAKKGTSEGGAKGVSTAAKGRGIKDIRSDAQKNRELAYDVGDKVGGARKDEFIASFKEKPTAKSLEELEKMSGAVAEKMVTKANLLPKYDFQAEHDNGVDLPTAILKKLIQDRIAPKPDPSTPETRKAYFAAMNKVQRHFAGIKSFENMRDALREMSVMARQAKAGEEAEAAIARYNANPERWSYFNSDSYKERAEKGKEAAKFMDFHALGDKFNSLLTNYESLNRSIDTVRKNTREGWDKYLNPQAPKKTPAKRGEENKRWEREAVSEHLRKGGKETKVKKPEDLMKEFNLRGVEFGHWVNDSSGLYHLKRSAEAFDDLADIIGVDKKDISLNGRLAIAFGARGKGGALAHYEPDRKVINMTKHGGAGSLAHEWGHAMDNILHQYSNGGQESLGLASQGQMGVGDPKLKALYNNLMEAITKPAPGDKGGVKKIDLDSEAKPIGRYYPEMRRDATGGMSPEDIYHKWSSKINAEHDRYIHNVKNGGRSEADKAKQIKKYEQARKRELGNLPQYIAQEMKYKNGGYRGEPYKGTIEVSTGKSEYMTRMEDTQPGKMQNGVHYYSAPEEMFARVFESYVQETMKKNKRENNYLVHGTGEGQVKAMGAPFPLGKERQHMFKAMKNLLDYVGKKGALKKALILEVLASGKGDMTEELRKSGRIEELDNLWRETLNNDIDRLRGLGVNAEHLRPMGSDTGVMPKRSAFNVPNPEEVIYIPVNRLKVVYQTEAATNWDKVEENRERMERGENLEPVVIGLNYDVHDGHHRYEASKLQGYEHIPCIVKGGNELDRQRALEAYHEVWKSLQPDPTNNQPNHVPFMYRGVGARELRNIHITGFIQSKGKGNDEDKETNTCFSNLYQQAEGYARSNYDLYNEKHAFVLVVRKPEDIEEDEHGELVAHRPIPVEDVVECVFIPHENYKNQ